MDIIEKITKIYETVLPKNPIMLNHDEAIEYFERLFMKGNIITYIKDDRLEGFLEFWRVDYAQFGRLCANITLAHDEDLLGGNIALITRMWINPMYRNGDAFKVMADIFLTRNNDATHFAAFQWDKRHKPLQVYTKEQILKHYN